MAQSMEDRRAGKRLALGRGTRVEVVPAMWCCRESIPQEQVADLDSVEQALRSLYRLLLSRSQNLYLLRCCCPSSHWRRGPRSCSKEQAAADHAKHDWVVKLEWWKDSDLGVVLLPLLG